MSWLHRSNRFTLVAATALFSSVPVFGGSFLTSLNFAQSEEAINHPVLYFGTGGERTIRVCLDPAGTDADVREPIVERTIATWNALAPQSNNLTTDVPAGSVDFETVLLHELGHCLFGLGHSNIAIPQDFVAGQATNADPGENELFDYGPGPDGAPGSLDDLRGDDVNRFWFPRFDNYPYLLLGPIDQTMYSRDLKDLPSGSVFAASANRLSGQVVVPPVGATTESVMNGYTIPGEAKRALQHDDVATFLYAASGLDELAGSSDDYTVNVVFQGQTTMDCDLIIEDFSSILGVTPVGVCNVVGIGVGGDIQHFRIAGQSTIQLDPNIDWYYGPEVFSDGFEDGTTGQWSPE